MHKSKIFVLAVFVASLLICSIDFIHGDRLLKYLNMIFTNVAASFLLVSFFRGK